MESRPLQRWACDSANDLANECRVRMGKIEMTFRPHVGAGGAGGEANGTRVVGDGILRRLAKVLSPPRD